MLLAHTVLLAATQIPEMEMSAEEAEKIAQSSVNVLRHYDIAQQSQKVIDWTALIGALGIIYGSRFAAFRVRNSKIMPSPLRTVK